MVPKKTDRANLETKKGLFIEIGLVIALALTLAAFEYTKEDLRTANIQAIRDVQGEEEIIPITRQELQKPQDPPKPKTVIIDLNIVEDDIELTDELDFESFDANQDDAIQIADVIGNKEEEEEDVEVFYIVETMPQFQGEGIEAFRAYIQKNVTYPQLALENGISGIVYVSFVINRRGELTNISILRSVDPSLDEEVIRALKAAPKWEPGKQRGKPVNVSFSIPIRFILN
ncbi:MAG: energy transducer TonB [Bacteroidales bacterium]|jgi:protein TonB|nr:energy transducer TonB [Bacteroidales bacterium]MDD2569725.1 energy transducer TonB [Bacteroidales bacterium]MDD2811878.1 energy transducer TonB [Bacteroidales bacterium]MDD3384173.1 energy transducer TonB [Bacteroidales bacterium]MDD3810833.1 energy transducer TonB [Bacteroidales bacterium]